MSDDGNSEHGGIDQSRMLIGGDETSPTRRFKSEVTFGPGEMTLNGRTGTQVKAPLVDEKEGSQEAFAFAPQVVVNHEACPQDRADEVENRIGEIARIGTNDSERQPVKN